MGEGASDAWASLRAQDNGVAEKPFDGHPRGVAAWTAGMQVEWVPMHDVHELQPFRVWSQVQRDGLSRRRWVEAERPCAQCDDNKGRSAAIANPSLRV